MPLEVTIRLCYLISYYQEYQHGCRAILWGGSPTRANWSVRKFCLELLCRMWTACCVSAKSYSEFVVSTAAVNASRTSYQNKSWMPSPPVSSRAESWTFPRLKELLYPSSVSVAKTCLQLQVMNNRNISCPYQDSKSNGPSCSLLGIVLFVSV